MHRCTQFGGFETYILSIPNPYDFNEVVNFSTLQINTFLFVKAMFFFYFFHKSTASFTKKAMFFSCFFLTTKKLLKQNHQTNLTHEPTKPLKQWKFPNLQRYRDRGEKWAKEDKKDYGCGRTKSVRIEHPGFYGILKKNRGSPPTATRDSYG